MEHDFQLELLTPEAVVLSGLAQEVIVPGSEGYFGVMAKHAHFATALKPGVLTVKMQDKTRRYDIKGGVVQVTPEKVVICAEGAVLQEIAHQ